MATPSNHSSGGRPESVSIAIREVLAGGPPADGRTGEGLLFRTNKGDFRGILHPAPGSRRAVVWVSGVRGGFGGPGPGIYAQMAGVLQGQGITSLRLDYRYPGDFQECVLDLLAGISYLGKDEYGPVVVVGHSFGGAVVIAAGAVSPSVKGVVCLSPQTRGAGAAAQLSPRNLLVVHGKSDTRLPYSCAQQIYAAALEPKKLVLYDGAEHRLAECREELEKLLEEWIPAALAT
jgi:alpha/beta superfamily hydrolase